MIRVIQYGEAATVLKASCPTTSECVATVARWRRRLAGRPGVRSVQPALDSLLLEYEPNFNLAAAVEELQRIDEAPPAEPVSANILRVPVCYEPAYGPDLQRVAAAAGLTTEEAIQLHCSAVYTVWMIGFMPGFAYMGELPERLQVERKKRPDPRIPAGSVAIAEEYVGIYPFDSPGGWHVIGRTPLKIVDYSRSNPWLFDYNMQVQFYAITS